MLKNEFAIVFAQNCDIFINLYIYIIHNIYNYIYIYIYSPPFFPKKYGTIRDKYSPFAKNTQTAFFCHHSLHVLVSLGTMTSSRPVPTPILKTSTLSHATAWGGRVWPFTSPAGRKTHADENCMTTCCGVYRAGQPSYGSTPHPTGRYKVHEGIKKEGEGVR